MNHDLSSLKSDRLNEQTFSQVSGRKGYTSSIDTFLQRNSVNIHHEES